MTRSDILKEIQKVFRQVFRDEKLEVQETTTADDIAMWDSMTHLELIAEAEQKFGIKFSFQQAMDFHSVGDMINQIEIQLSKK